MADSNVQLSPDSTGKKMDTRTEATNSEHRQVMVIGDPSVNAGVAPVDATKGLAVDLTATGANSTALKVDGSAVTQPVSGTVTANLGTIAGVSTAAKQPALGTAGTASADVISVQGIASMTKLLVTPDSVALPANQSVNVSQINAVTPLMGNGTTGTGSQRVTIASDNTAFSVNAVQSGTWTVQQGSTPASLANAWPTEPVGLGRTTLPTAVSSATNVQQLFDRYGRAYMLDPVLTTASSAGTAITTNTNTSIVAAPSAGTHLRMYRLQAQNSSSTATWAYWGNGSGVKTVPVYLAQNQIVSLNLHGSWELSTATALFMNTATTGANIEWFVEYETLAD